VLNDGASTAWLRHSAIASDPGRRTRGPGYATRQGGQMPAKGGLRPPDPRARMQTTFVGVENCISAQTRLVCRS
jgi:hypothetical protein